MTGPPRSWQGPPAQVPARSPRAVLDLGAVLTAPGCARAWTREILWEWGAAELTDTAELVASELVTNSVTHAPGPDGAVIRLVLSLDQGELAILVRDDHPGAPLAARPGADDESGRGLLIVEQLSDRCGWYPLKDPNPAKVTWAVLRESGRSVSGPGRHGPGALLDGAVIRDSQLAPALPVRNQASSPGSGMRPMRRAPVDPDILARVKAALERL